MAGGERDALRVIAGAGRDDAPCAFGLGEVRDAVVGAAQLVAEDRLQIFALQQDLVAAAAATAARRGSSGVSCATS